MCIPVQNEEWRSINGTKYEVSSLGRLRRGEKILSGWLEKSGYRRVDINGHKYYFHILVCNAFNQTTYPAGTKTVVHHKNGVKTDNRACNL